jgi:hypothetical protein
MYAFSAERGNRFKVGLLTRSRAEETQSPPPFRSPSTLKTWSNGSLAIEHSILPTFLLCLDVGWRAIGEYGLQNEDRIKSVSKIYSREAVGKLLYLSITTRPEIFYAANVRCSSNSNPGSKHWDTATGLFRHLKQTNYSSRFMSRPLN